MPSVWVCKQYGLNVFKNKLIVISQFIKVLIEAQNNKQ